MPEIWTIVIVAALVVIVALVALALGRLTTLVAAREGAAREAADLRTRLEVLASKSDDFERDLRQDFTNARTEQAAAAHTARSELTATLGQLTQANEKRLDAIRL